MGYTSLFDKWKKEVKKEIDKAKVMEDLIKILRNSADEFADWLEDNPQEKRKC